MESAIDTHLVCPRSLSRRVPEEYVPPFPMFVGRAPTEVEQVVMAYLGVQYRDGVDRHAALAALNDIASSFEGVDGPVSHDLTQHTDAQGYENLMAVAYWSRPDSYQRWEESEAVAGWWSSPDRLSGPLGFFREVVSPRVEQFETLYAFREDFPGVGSIMNRVSDEVEEHGYWGSMRDRIPASQTDWMKPTGELRVVSGDPASGGRVVVQAHDNIALIRSGQDWTTADEAERALYLDELLPTLQAGMDFLRDEGAALGCYSNRFVRSIDRDGNELDESYNIGHWRSLEKLERWAESHPTHLRIFTTFFKVVAGLEKLRLYHEVSTFDGANQTYEYLNCHPATGLVRDAVPVAAPAVQRL